MSSSVELQNTGDSKKEASEPLNVSEKDEVAVKAEVDEDAEPDCCAQPGCLCSPYKDEPAFNNWFCKGLREKITARVALAIFCAAILGAIISTGRPIEPNDRLCEFPNSDVQWTPGPGEECSDIGTVNLNLTAIDLVNFQKHILMCMDDPDNVVVTTDADSCRIKYYLNTSQPDDVQYCYGLIEGTPFMSQNDNSDCEKFKKLTDASTAVVVYTGERLMVDYLLKKDDTSVNKLIWGEVDGDSTEYSISPCVNTAAACSGENFVVGASEERASSSAAIHEQYTADLKAYRDILNYMFQFPGKLWLRALKLIILPLIVANIICSVAALKEMPGSGKLGCATFCYYLVTTMIAAVEGLVFSAIFLVGFMEKSDMMGVPMADAPARGYQDTGSQIKSVFNAIVPTNGVGAAYNNNYLGVIFFSVIAGVAMTNPKDSVFLKWFSELNTTMMRLIEFLVQLSPLGIFFLMTYLCAYKDIAVVLPKVALFLSSVFVGLAVHNFVVYPLIYFVMTRKNPFIYWYNILEAAFFALVISSSIVTLPITMRCAIQKNKIDEHIAKFVLTLGATVNMDGTTIGFPIAIVFVAYGQGIILSFGEMVTIAILSTVSSMGAAPIPQAGLVLLMVMLDNLDIPMEGPFIMVMAVDWLYDRPETMTNIVGDSFAAGVLDHLFKGYQSSAEQIKQENDVVKRISGNDPEESGNVQSEA